MADTRYTWDSFKADSNSVFEKMKEAVHEGNVRRILVEHDGKTVAEFPLTAGVVGVVLAPMVAAIAALVALLKDCTIKIEREETPPAPPSEPV